MGIDTRAVIGMVAVAGFVAATAAAAEAKGPAKTMPMTTKSPAAHDQLVELQRRIETFQFTGNEERAKQIVAADPDFALGVYYLSAVTPGPGNQQHLDKAVELARKGGASDAEKRFIEAMVLGGAAGLAREMFFSADNYFLEINPELSEQPMAKMLLLAATLAVDIIYKSESRTVDVGGE